MPGILIRKFRNDDAAATARLFHDAVHQGAASHYDPVQRDAWAPEVPETEYWCEKLATKTTLVAEYDRHLAGFMSMTRKGHIGLAYTAPSQIRRGIASALYQRIEETARADGLPNLSTEASYLARPFFERHGWRVITEQTVTRRGVAMTNFVMQKELETNVQRI